MDEILVLQCMLARLIFHRGLPSTIQLSSCPVTCELKIGTEFNEFIDSVKICDYKLAVQFIEASSPQELRMKLQCRSTQYSLVPYTVKKKNKGHIAHLTLDLPISSSSGYFRFACEGSEDVVILSLLSDLETVLSPFPSPSSLSLPMLSNYRIFHIPNITPASYLSILIKESYGELLGSHVYDCSVLLLSHIHCTILPRVLHLLGTGVSHRQGIDKVSEHSAEQDGDGRAIVIWELGAGLGVVSIALARCLAETLASTPIPTPTPAPTSI
ncbi:hypothetical protein EON65_36830, partial [archaeon]